MKRCRKFWSILKWYPNNFFTVEQYSRVKRGTKIYGSVARFVIGFSMWSYYVRINTTRRRWRYLRLSLLLTHTRTRKRRTIWSTLTDISIGMVVSKIFAKLYAPYGLKKVMLLTKSKKVCLDRLVRVIILKKQRGILTCVLFGLLNNHKLYSLWCHLYNRH